LAGTVALTGCEDSRFDVENPNDPDRERALQDDADLQAVLSGGYVSWWEGVHENYYEGDWYSPAPHLHGWGDALSSTNAYSGFWNVATNEPTPGTKPQFPNTLSAENVGILEGPYNGLNSAVSSANDVLREIEIERPDRPLRIDGEDVTQRTRAGAYLLRGLSYGYLANIYDQAFITTQEFDAEEDLEDLEFQDYSEVLDQAISDLGQAREIAENNSFTLPDVLPFSQAMTASRLERVASSYEARFRVSQPRTPAEAENINWGTVSSLAENGIEEDLVLELDGDQFFSIWTGLTGIHWYFRVDNRIIQKMAAQHGEDDYPIKYPADDAGAAIDPAKSMAQAGEGDARLCPAEGDEISGSGKEKDYFDPDGTCWFVYDTDQSYFTLPRGPTLQSNYYFSRPDIYEQWDRNPTYQGPSPIFLAEENDLMEAEAAIRSNGDVATARSIVNEGSRVEVGELDPLPSDATQDEVLEAIQYERDIQLYRTGTGLQYFDMRRLGKLQTGTPLHMPVPAPELQTVQVDLYTFGGASNAGQPGTASGDNAWCEEFDAGCDGSYGPYENETFEEPENANSQGRTSPTPSKARVE
jgi:hypothetical protein